MNEIKMIDGEEMHITFNGSWISAVHCICKSKCIECNIEINHHLEDSEGEYCITCCLSNREGEEE